MVFLNDFEYDTGAKDWMPWAYFKDFLEGSKVKVAVPKTGGGNQVFQGDAPVFLTAPGEVTSKKLGKEALSETLQMRKRIRYLTLQWQIPEDRRQEVVQVCSRCSARLCLEGKPFLDQPAGSHAATSALVASQVEAGTSAGPPAKKPRTAAEVVKELTDLSVLLGEGLVSREEFAYGRLRIHMNRLWEKNDALSIEVSTSTGAIPPIIGNQCEISHACAFAQEIPTSTGPEAPKYWKPYHISMPLTCR